MCLQSCLHITTETRIPFKKLYAYEKGFPGGSVSKHSACNAGEHGSGRFPGEENDNPLQYSCLENSWTEDTDRTTVHGNESCLVMSNSLWPRSTPGLPVHHQLPEFTQTHVHRVSDAVQSSHPLSSPSPPVPNPSQHQSLFQGVNSSYEVAKVLEFQL